MNADFRVLDFDLVYDRAQVGAAEREGAVHSHEGGEGTDFLFGDTGFRLKLGEGAVLGGLCLVAFGLEDRQPVLQRWIGCVGDAVFDRIVEP